MRSSKTNEHPGEVGVVRPDVGMDSAAEDTSETRIKRLLDDRSHLNNMIHTVERYSERKSRVLQILDITKNLVTDLKNADIPYVESSQAECYLRNSSLWLAECVVRLDVDIAQTLEAIKP